LLEAPRESGPELCRAARPRSVVRVPSSFPLYPHETGVAARRPVSRVALVDNDDLAARIDEAVGTRHANQTSTNDDDAVPHPKRPREMAVINRRGRTPTSNCGHPA